MSILTDLAAIRQTDAEILQMVQSLPNAEILQRVKDLQTVTGQLAADVAKLVQAIGTDDTAQQIQTQADRINQTANQLAQAVTDHPVPPE